MSDIATGDIIAYMDAQLNYRGPDRVVLNRAQASFIRRRILELIEQRDKHVAEIEKHVLILKHYSLQQDALNEIAETIALDSGDEPERTLEHVDGIAAYARQIDLTNPHTQPKQTKFIAHYDGRASILSLWKAQEAARGKAREG